MKISVYSSLHKTAKAFEIHHEQGRLARSYMLRELR